MFGEYIIYTCTKGKKENTTKDAKIFLTET